VALSPLYDSEIEKEFWSAGSKCHSSTGESAQVAEVKKALAAALTALLSDAGMKKLIVQSYASATKVQHP
jgi:hypothetical protein